MEPTETPELSELPQVQTDESETRAADPDAEPDTDLVESELLVEEISIDGMCGVY